MKTKTKHIKKVLWIAGVLGLAWFGRDELAASFHLLGDRDQVVGLLSGYGSAGPVLMAILLVLQVFLAWIPGHVLMVAGGYLYGFQTAFLITAATTILGSQLAFLLARRAGRPLVERFVPENMLDKWESAAERQGAVFFLFSFWMPVFPSDMMCFIAGLGSISSRRFLAANILGRLPCAALMVVLGSHAYRLPAQFWVAAVLLMGLVFAAWKLVKMRTVRVPLTVN